MRYSHLFNLPVLFVLAASPVVACKCAPFPPGSTPPPSVTERTTQDPDGAVFEGMAVKAELRGDVIDAKEGELIPADWDSSPPFMLVTFSVSQSYPADTRKTAEVRTGLGGGDCGVPFEVGKRYLVDAAKDKDGHLIASICSQTAPREAKTPHGTEASLEEGEICGHIVAPNQGTPIEGQVFLYSVGNKSPVPADESEVQEDNSFCAEQVSPGKYFLLFVGGREGAPDAIAYYPEAIERADASTVEVRPGEQIQNVSIRVPLQATFFVRGTVAGFKSTNLDLTPKVLLLQPDQFSLGTLYRAEVRADGSFEFRQVLRGKYCAVVEVESFSDSKWLTRKVSLGVERDVSGLSLSLIQK